MKLTRLLLLLLGIAFVMGGCKKRDETFSGVVNRALSKVSCHQLAWERADKPSSGDPEEWQYICRDTQRVEGIVIYFDHNHAWDAYQRGRTLGSYKSKEAACAVVESKVRP